MRKLLLFICVGLVLLTACSSKDTALSCASDNALSSFVSDASRSSQTITDKTSMYSTCTTAAKPSPAYPLRKSWDSVSDETKRMLQECGISYDDIFVDKSRLNYDRDNSLTEIHPKYSRYSLGDRWYSFNDLNGKLTYASLSKNHDFVEGKSEEEIRRIAETFADLFVDTTEYQCTYMHYDETARYYSFEFEKTVNGYRTFSGVGVDLFADGKIGAFSITKIGLFDNVAVPSIDEKTIKQKCGEILRERYDDLDRFEMKDLSKAVLDIKDGQLLAYYQKQPDIEYGQLVLICECKPYFTNGKYGRLEFVLVPLGE